MFESDEREANLVSKFQKELGYTSPANLIVHAALYLGYGVMSHAIPFLMPRPLGGIVIERVWDEISKAHRRIYVLRYERLKPAHRTEIALYGSTRSQRNSGYDWKGLVRLLICFMESYQSTSSEGTDFSKGLYTSLLNWFVVGQKRVLPDRHDAKTSKISDPKDLFGGTLSKTIKANDKFGLFKPDGVPRCNYPPPPHGGRFCDERAAQARMLTITLNGLAPWSRAVSIAVRTSASASAAHMAR